MMMDRSQLTRNLFRDFFNDLEAAACITSDGEVIALKYETLADIGTLPLAGQTATKYFHLKDGDLVLLNDPYSGGTTLSMMTLITPLAHLDAGHTLYLLARIGFRPRLVLSKVLEEEGLRVPPTPIAHGRVMNEPILDAVSAHPLCPEGFRDRLNATAKLLWKKVDLFKVLAQRDKDLLSRSSVKNLLQQSRKRVSDMFNEIPHGEAKVETKLDSGELIKLKVQASAEKIDFDFSGTSASKRTCLTDAATVGACIGALASYLPQNAPMDSGFFSLIHVTTPLGSLLNAKYPSPTFKGMTDGCVHVAATVLKALSELSPVKTVSPSGQNPLMLHFHFVSGPRFFDSLPGGIGATSQFDGADALAFWVKNGLRNSVQEIESRYPLQIQSISVRKDSGGKGQYRGGNGLQKVYLIGEHSKFNWVLEQRKHPPKGQQGGASGLPAEIRVAKHDGKIINVDSDEGELTLSPGDQVIALSAGGAGFGK